MRQNVKDRFERVEFVDLRLIVLFERLVQDPQNVHQRPVAFDCGRRVDVQQTDGG